MFVYDAWYVAAWQDQLSTTPLARRICDQPLVLYRSAQGVPVALLDRCCHRGAPLSVGSVVEQGLQCNYHGLIFGNDGRCVHIPGQDTIPDKACVRSFPLVEKDALVWIWMGDPARADPERIVAYPFHNDHAKWPHRHDVYTVKSNYLLLIDNLMDLTHLGYVHNSTVGGDAQTHIDAKTDAVSTERGVRVTRWMPACDPPPTYRKAVAFTGKVDRWQDFEYFAPGVVVQWTGAVGVGRGAQDPANREGGFSLRLFHGVTPETETTSLYFWSASNGYRQDDPQATELLFHEIAEAFTEDKHIVELQQARITEIGDTGLVNIRSDVARVRMRRAVEQLIPSARAASE